jgi:hypothetical protein
MSEHHYLQQLLATITYEWRRGQSFLRPFRLTDRTCSKMAARVNTIALLRHTLAFYMQVYDL